jgi:hypothetical protein
MRTDVIWPFGWTAWREGEEIALFDDIGNVVARTGDRAAFGGGFVERPIDGRPRRP